MSGKAPPNHRRAHGRGGEAATATEKGALSGTVEINDAARAKLAKVQRAIKLRDTMLAAVKAHGWHALDGLVTMSYRGPLARASRERMPYCYGLEIWRPGKVLNIEWTEEGLINVVTFKEGPWEAELTALVVVKLH